MAMSKQHKDALAKGRREAKAIKAYLEALGSRRPGRPVTAQSIKSRIAAIQAKLAAETDALRRVDLLQDRIEAQAALDSSQGAVNQNELEAAFVKVVAAYSDRKGISYTAWREAGVPAEVLRRAGIARTRRS